MPEALFEQDFVCAPTGRFPSCHCSTIVALPGGELLAAWYAGSEEAKADVAILTARKPPGAAAWGEPTVAVDDDPAKPMGNCVLWVDGKGRVRLFYNVMHGKLDGPWGPGVRWDTCDCRCRISDDGGRTWGDVVMLRRELNCVFRTKPLVHSSGDIVIGVEHSRGNSHFFISSDQGASWILTDQIPGVPNLHPTLIERADGSILALLRPEKYHRIARSVSTDRARTWTTAQDTELPNPGAAVDMVKLRDGRVALAFNNSARRRSPLTLALSLDEGETWPQMRDLETEDGEFSYPAIIEDPSGLIHVTYTHRRTHIAHARLSPSWIGSA